MKSFLAFSEVFSFYHFRSVFLIAILILCFLVTGCATFGYPKPAPDCAQFGMKPLPFPMERLDFETFTITPPHGDNWCIVGLDRGLGEDSIEKGWFFKNRFGGKILQKAPNQSEINQTLSIIFGVDDLNDMFQRYSKAVGKDINKVSSIDELVTYTRKYIENDLSSPNVKIVRKLDIFPYSSRSHSLCVRISYVIEGTQLSEIKPNDVFVYDSNTIQCIHPTRPLMFSIHYSERYPAQYPPSNLLVEKYWHEIEPCFNGFELIP